MLEEPTAVGALEAAREEQFCVEQERQRREAARHRAEAERERDAPMVPWWQQPEPSTFQDWNARQRGELRQELRVGSTNHRPVLRETLSTRR